MQTVTTIGLDIAKSVFQVHGVDAAGQVLIRRQLKRRTVLAFFEKLPPCLVGIEACASSHHWSRELQALGHTVRLMPPAYVKPYVKRLAAMMHRQWEDFSAEQHAYFNTLHEYEQEEFMRVLHRLERCNELDVGDLKLLSVKGHA